MLSFEFFKTDKGFGWRMKMPNREILLRSGYYATFEDCQNSAEAARRSSFIKENYELRTNKNEHTFLLKAVNGEILGRSESFVSAKARDAAIQTILTNMQLPGIFTSDEPPNPGLTEFVKIRRRKAGLTQEELAERAGVGLRFLRELEQGKETLRMDKVNQVLKMFGHELRPMPLKRNIS